MIKLIKLNGIEWSQLGTQWLKSGKMVLKWVNKEHYAYNEVKWS